MLNSFLPINISNKSVGQVTRLNSLKQITNKKIQPIIIHKTNPFLGLTKKFPTIILPSVLVIKSNIHLHPNLQPSQHNKEYSISSSPTTTPPVTTPSILYIPNTNDSLKDNEAVDDSLSFKNPTSIRVFPQNVNDLDLISKEYTLETTCESMFDNNIDISCLSETNIYWKHKKGYATLKRTTSRL